MSVTLELPEALVDEISEGAARRGLTVAEYVQRMIVVGRVGDKMPQTGAELVAYWQREGVIGGRTDITDSPRHARALRAEAEQRA